MEHNRGAVGQRKLEAPGELSYFRCENRAGRKDGGDHRRHLADRCLKKGATAIGHNGKPFTAASIGGAIATRAPKRADVLGAWRALEGRFAGGRRSGRRASAVCESGPVADPAGVGCGVGAVGYEK